MTKKRKGRPARRPLENADVSQRKVLPKGIAQHGQSVAPADEYDVWHAGHKRRAAAVLADLDKLHEDTRVWARKQTARRYRNPTPENRQAERAAWALVTARSHGLDALGDPIDPSPAGRAKFERAWLLATGHPFTHPDDEDTNPEHEAGEHAGTSLRRSYAGDLPACGSCMEDELWALTHRYWKAPR